MNPEASQSERILSSISRLDREEGQQAHGHANGVNFSFPFFAHVLNDVGQTAFVGTVTGAGVNYTCGIWSEGSGQSGAPGTHRRSGPRHSQWCELQFEAERGRSSILDSGELSKSGNCGLGGSRKHGSCDIEQINHALLVQCFRQTDDRAHGRIAVFAGFNPRDGLASHAGPLGKLRQRETG